MLVGMTTSIGWLEPLSRRAKPQVRVVLRPIPPSSAPFFPLSILLSGDPRWWRTLNWVRWGLTNPLTAFVLTSLPRSLRLRSFAPPSPDCGVQMRDRFRDAEKEMHLILSPVNKPLARSVNCSTSKKRLCVLSHYQASTYCLFPHAFYLHGPSHKGSKERKRECKNKEKKREKEAWERERELEPERERERERDFNQYKRFREKDDRVETLSICPAALLDPSASQSSDWYVAPVRHSGPGSKAPHADTMMWLPLNTHRSYLRLQREDGYSGGGVSRLPSWEVSRDYRRQTSDFIWQFFPQH